MKIWGSVKNIKIIGVFYLYGTFKKRKGNLGQKCVKRGLLSFQGKTGKIVSDFPRKMTVFQFWLYFSTCPSLKSGIPTCTKFIFLDRAIIGLFARKFDIVICKTVDLVAI